MNRKLTATFAAMLIALSLAGISYALWSKTLYIWGSVDTGDLNAEITDWFCNDQFSIDPPGIDPGWDKDVGWTDCWIDPLDPQIAYLEIHNGYPCYTVHYSITILNTGNVPWILQGYAIDGIPLPENVWVPIDLDGDGFADIEFYMHDSLGEQREPGLTIESSMDTHILQEAHEDFTYPIFALTFEVVQWNEYVP